MNVFLRYNFFFVLTILVNIVLSSSCDVPEEDHAKHVNIKLFLGEEGENVSRAKTNEDLIEGIGTELIGVFPASEGFSQEYKNSVNSIDWSLTDLIQNSVILNLPINQSLKIHAYRFSEKIVYDDLWEASSKPISFGISDSFIIKESTTSLKIKLKITPNGIPGILSTVSGVTDDQGKEALVSIQLTTPPKEPVWIDLSLSNTSYSKSLSSNLIFSPSDWSNEQKVTLQGIKKNSEFSGKAFYFLNLENFLSEDQDYNGLSSDSIEITHLETILPVLEEVTKIPSVTGNNTPVYSFKTSEKGTLFYNGSCESSTSAVESGIQIIKFLSLIHI